MITSIIMLAVAAYLWRLGRELTEIAQQRESPPAVIIDQGEISSTNPPTGIGFKIGRN
jgi:hypothetical protein